MRLLYKLEFACGLITLLCGAVVITVSFGTNAYAAKPTSNPLDFLSVILISAFITALVAFGSYAHAIKRIVFGFYILIGCGFITLGLLFLLLIVMAGSWYYPTWLALVSLAPYLMTLF